MDNTFQYMDADFKILYEITQVQDKICLIPRVKQNIKDLTK